jgi:CBS-domain-containing membrane protein
VSAKISELMTRDVVAVNRYTPFKDIARTLFDREISAVPVLDDSCRVIGIVCAADLVEQQARHAAGNRRDTAPHGGPERYETCAVSAETLMTSPVVTVTPDTDAATAARLMNRNAVKHLPVINQTGRLVGIVSEKDLLAVFLRPDLEIQDEIVRSLLLAEPDVDMRALSVQVRDGIATFSGSVADSRLAQRVIGLIRAVDGVVEIVVPGG